MGAPEEIVAHVREYIHDQKHFSARLLTQIKTNSGLDIEVELIAQIFGGIVSIALLHGEQAQFLANFLLILVPSTITYIYPKERPPVNLLLIYWGIYSSLTLLDNGLHDTLPAYYVIKVLLMSLMFLKPFCGAQKIQEALEKSKLGIDLSDRENDSNAFNEDELRAFQKARKKKSPPPEKPEGEDVPPSQPLNSVVKSNKTVTATKSTVSKKSANISSEENSKRAKTDLKTSKKVPAKSPVQHSDGIPEPEAAKSLVAEPVPVKIEQPPPPVEVVPPSSQPTTKTNEDSLRVASAYVKLPIEGGESYQKDEPKKKKKKESKNSTVTLTAEKPAPSPAPISEKKKDDSTRQTASSYFKLPSEGADVVPTVSSTPSVSSIPPPKKTDDSSRQIGSTYIKLASEGDGTYNKPVINSLPVKTLPIGGNDDDYFRIPPKPAQKTSNSDLKSTESAASIETQPGQVSSDDLVFTPKKQIVFNGAFTDNTTIDHMTLQNKSQKWIAFAIKSNAIPRITCQPPSGVIKPGEKAVIAVQIAKFDPNQTKCDKDRISYEYVFCQPDTKAFTHGLLQGNETRRRKNIKIVYNV